MAASVKTRRGGLDSVRIGEYLSCGDFEIGVERNPKVPDGFFLLYGGGNGGNEPARVATAKAGEVREFAELLLEMVG